ncbi:hypothetical protein C922_05760 [Plasmodium inui San Antonio 1]|uniref:Uncharacterized protein n=1 Tax=Plasmodium inui San Antonio 1 TaxID=1237626 RepID=W6ZX73_9APIC|nr:hypothetical protein C922_05760 [Plasmodium inui San Antonio 1]EUD63860.1 hypothetical protein C922_05760 [Plasmodium inui San Antonio 1]
MNYFWTTASPRLVTAESYCSEEYDQKYCYKLPTFQGKYDRTKQGLATWLNSLGVGTNRLSNQAAGYVKGFLKRGGDRSPLEWQDIVDDIINFMVKNSRNRNNTDEDKGYLGLAETRLWEAFIPREDRTPCNNRSDCQKLLTLIGCVIYWFWEQGTDLIRKEGVEWQSCKRLKKKFLDNNKELLTIGKGGWTRIQRSGEVCQSGNSFSQCSVESLSIVLSVSHALANLCPDCPQPGLDHILGDRIIFEDFKCFKCIRKEGQEGLCQRVDQCEGQTVNKDGICFCDPHQVQDFPTKREEERSISQQVPQVSIKDQSNNSPTSEGRSEVNQALRQAQSQSQISGETQREKQPGKGNHLSQSLDVLDQETSRRNSGGIGPTANLSTQQDDRSQRNSLVGESNSTIQGNHLSGPTNQDNSPPQTAPTRDQRAPPPHRISQGESNQEHVGGAVAGGIVSVIMFIAASYGLYRVYGRRNRAKRRDNGRVLDKKIVYYRAMV